MCSAENTYLYKLGRARKTLGCGNNSDVHAGSGKSICYLLSTFSLYYVKVIVFIIYLNIAECTQTLLPAIRFCKQSMQERRGWLAGLGMFDLIIGVSVCMYNVKVCICDPKAFKDRS